MCGIAGIFSFKDRQSASVIRTMADTLKHRGPDDEGYLAVNLSSAKLYHLVGDDSRVDGPRIDQFRQDANLFLAHRRLSIIDLSPAGHQPMSNHDQTLWITYNGEIYNYIELQEELKNLGYRFKSATDTEVILAAYQIWGADCVQKFNGMWAFVIYDKNQNVLFGSRDRFGVKPFYYFFDGNYFAFASEIKALLRLPFIKREINTTAVFDYLAMGLIEHEEEGFFKNILELKPSHSFSLNLQTGILKKWQYYALAYDDSWERFDAQKSKEYTGKIRELIFNAIKIRLRSDVPVGSCLSGGIDSSSVVCVINELLKKESIFQIGERQKIFTARYNDSSLDEGRWAKIVTDRTRTSWHQTFPDAHELFNDLEDLVYSQDIPFGSTSIYAQYRVMKLAKEAGIKVLLDGQGGDELFTGYACYYVAFFWDALKNHDISRCNLELRNLRNAPIRTQSLLKYLIGYGILRIAPDGLNEFLSKRRMPLRCYIAKDLLNEHRDRLNRIGAKVPVSLNKMLHEHIGNQILRNLLRYEDRNSMRFAIESRTPFADDVNLINYVFQIPSSYKIFRGWSKYLLREAMCDILPGEIKCRTDKINFATPEYHWLNEIKDRLKEYVVEDLKQFVDVELLLRDWDGIFQRQSNANIADLWRLINVAVWMKVFSRRV